MDAQKGRRDSADLNLFPFISSLSCSVQLSRIWVGKLSPCFGSSDRRNSCSFTHVAIRTTSSIQIFLRYPHMMDWYSVLIYTSSYLQMFDGGFSSHVRCFFSLQCFPRRLLRCDIETLFRISHQRFSISLSVDFTLPIDRSAESFIDWENRQKLLNHLALCINSKRKFNSDWIGFERSHIDKWGSSIHGVKILEKYTGLEIYTKLERALLKVFSSDLALSIRVTLIREFVLFKLGSSFRKLGVFEFVGQYET